MGKSQEEKERKFGKVIGAILGRFEKRNAKAIKQADRAREAGGADSGVADLLDKVEEWKKISQKINDVIHFIGAELEERGYPCSGAISPIFHPDTRQTYTCQVLFQVSLVQLDELENLMSRKPFGLFGHKPCREEVCAKALEVASTIRFVEDLVNRRVKVTEAVYSKGENAFTLEFDEIGKKRIKEVMEGFIIRVFAAD